MKKKKKKITKYEKMEKLDKKIWDTYYNIIDKKMIELFKSNL